MTLEVTVVGAGAIGSAVAGRLAAAGQRVSIVARGARREVLGREGLRFVENGTEQTVFPALVSLSDIGKADLVILATKAHSLPSLLPEIASMLTPGARLLPMINGLPWWYFSGLRKSIPVHSVDPNENLLPLFDGDRIIGCVVYTRALIDRGGVVRVHGAQHVRLGSVAGPPPHMIAEFLAKAGIRVDLEDDIRRELWRKLMLNASTNPLSALMGSTLEQMGSDPWLGECVCGVAQEVMELSKLFGYDIDMSLDGILEVVRNAGSFPTSMLQDVGAGRDLELGALVDAPLELARCVGHPMPRLQQMSALLRAKVQLGRDGNAT
jgi:2-dehydropantoate 2-reductase